MAESHAIARVIHNSRDVFYRDPPGAVPVGTTIRLRLLVKVGKQPKGVRVRVWSAEEVWQDMILLGFIRDGYLYETILTAPDEPTLVWYDFRVDTGEITISYGNAPDKLGGEGAVWAELPPSFQLTVYDAAFAPPEWMKRAVVYQIMPDRFYRDAADGDIDMLASMDGRMIHAGWYDPPGMGIDPDSRDYCASDFYGGTLNGIRRKLPYLSSLGITCLYLNPIFESPANHHYDTTDYHRVDPMLGTADDLAALCEDAAGHGIRVMLDGVFSHVGSSSPYFQSAVSDEASPYRDWFRFDRWPDRYDCWWGVPSLPNVNEMAGSYRDFILTGERAVVPRWMRSGVTGWRLDVADELPMPFLRQLRQTVKRENPDAAVIGEVWENASCKVAYGEMRSYVLGDTLDSVMNYPLRASLVSFLTGSIGAGQAVRQIDALMEQYPKPFAYALMNLMGSHDRARILNVLVGADGGGMPRSRQGDLRLSKAQLALAQSRLYMMFAFIIAWPGMPALYYGDEAGMTGASDPYCRAAFPWGREDPEVSVRIKELLTIRMRHAVLAQGDAWLVAPDDDTIIIIRAMDDATALAGEPADAAVFAMNRGDNPKVITHPLPRLGGKTLPLITQHIRHAALTPSSGGQYTIELQAGGYGIWIGGNNKPQ